jgi:hypothetical protein
MRHVRNFTQATSWAVQEDQCVEATHILADASPLHRLYELLRKEVGKGKRRWRVPYLSLTQGAKYADVFQAVMRRSVPFTSDVLARLIEPAWYSTEAALRNLGYRLCCSFADVVPDLIAE